MKAIAVAPARRAVELLAVEAPQLDSPSAVRLRMLEVGVCGTDREICAMDYGTPPSGGEHLVIGHEALAEVVEVGPEVAGVQPGDLVVPTVRRPCRHAHCVPCRTGRQDFCITGDFRERGIKELHGFMTEFVVDDQRYMNVVPPSLREVGVLIEPLTIAEKAMMQVELLQQRLPWACTVQPGGRQYCHKAVVLGAGPVGLLGAMKLVASNFDTYVYSRSDGGERQAIVEAFGARFVPAEQVPASRLGDELGGIDLIYEAMGASQTSFEAMAALGQNGVFVFTGVPGRKAPVAIDTDLLMRNMVLRNQVVLGTVNAGSDAFAAAVADLQRFVELWPDAVPALISGRHPMERFAELLLQRTPGIKHVIEIG
ncbi:MAG TPA: glucose 1-dehydrogenase [Planctomycetota bacterium]